jgi:hypothetical protein
MNEQTKRYGVWIWHRLAFQTNSKRELRKWLANRLLLLAEKAATNLLTCKDLGGADYDWSYHLDILPRGRYK